MSGLERLVVFALEERRYALDLSAVRRVIRSVDITPLPKAPEIVLLTLHDNAEYRSAAKHAASDGFVSKSNICTHLHSIIDALRKAFCEGGTK